MNNGTPYIATEFDSEALYQKAKLYINKYENTNKTDSWRTFWMVLSLEFLLRSSLAKISPVLVADNKHEISLLAAVGRRYSSDPLKSIGVGQVIDRIKNIQFDGFTDDIAKKSRTLMELRNDELHSGVSRFCDEKKSVISDYYTISNILLKFLDKPIDKFFEPSEYSLVKIYLKNIDADVKKRVDAQLIYRQEEYNALTKATQDDRIKNSISVRDTNKPYKTTKCLACNNDVLIEGKLLKVESEKMEDGMVKQTILCVPDSLKCYCCEFHLDNINEFKALNLADAFNYDLEIDPVEHYNIDIGAYIDDDMLDERAKDLHYEHLYADE